MGWLLNLLFVLQSLIYRMWIMLPKPMRPVLLIWVSLWNMRFGEEGGRLILEADWGNLTNSSVSM